MKKIFYLVFALALILSIFTVTTFAISPETPENLPSDELTGIGGTDDRSDTVNDVQNEKFYSEWIDKITDSTMWINIGATLAGMISVIAFVKSRLDKIRGNIGALLNGQVSKDTIKHLIDEAVSGAIAEYNASYEDMKANLEAQRESERTIISVLAVFITNAKISAHAKAEIMSMLTGAKTTLGSVEETVAAANAAIEEAKAAEEKVDTPALDAVMSAARPDEPYMELG